MKKVIMFLLTVLLICCNHREPVLRHESGIVIKQSYFPGTEHVGTGTGYSTSGHLVIVTTVSGEDEKYITLIRCEHQAVFAVQSQNVYGKLKEGDSIRIDYYNIVNRKGEVVKYEFVDANKISQHE